MAAPKLGHVVLRNGNAQTFLYQANRFSQLLIEGEIQHLSNNFYSFTNNRLVFILKCSDCKELGCSEPRIRKLGERGGSGTGNWNSYFAHFSALEKDHAEGCLCADGAVTTGPRIKRRILESRVYIPADIHDYFGRYRHPLIMEIMRPSDDLTNSEQNWLIQNINAGLGENVEQVTEELLQPEILWKGIVHSNIIQRLNIHMSNILSYYLGQRNFHDLNHIFWKKSIDNTLIPLRITSDEHRANLKITGSGHYYKACSEGSRVVAAPLRGGRIQPGSREELIGWFQEEVETRGLEPIVKQLEIQCTIFKANQRVRFVYLKNRSIERKRIRFSVQEIGSAQDHEREEMTTNFGGTMPSDYVGSQEGEQFTSIEIEGKDSKLIRILFTGNVHFRIEHQGQLIDNQHIMAARGDAPARLKITREALTTEEFQGLIQEFYPNYLALPTQGTTSHIQKKDWIDFDRFMFTKSYFNARDGQVAPQGIAARNTRLLNLLTSFETPFVDDEVLDTGTTDRFQTMMETSYSGIETEAVRLEDEEITFVHRLRPTESGWFGPRKSSYKLLIDHRSWSHLLSDCPQLEPDDIRFLESGHRLIQNRAINRYDRGELQEIEHLQPNHSLPEDHLFSPFDNGDKIEQQQRYQRLVGNLQPNSATEYTYAKPFNEQPRFAVFSRDLRTSFGLQEPWSQSEPFVIEREINDDQLQVLTLHRIVLEPEGDVEGVESKHNIVLILRQENAASRAIRIFHTESISCPPSHSTEDWDALTQKARRIVVYNYMRDTIRAFTSLSMRLGGNVAHIPVQKVNEVVSYTVRKFCEGHEQSLLNTMNEIDEVLSAHFLRYMEEKMWLRKVN